jgi:hypothetical protein
MRVGTARQEARGSRSAAVAAPCRERALLGEDPPVHGQVLLAAEALTPAGSAGGLCGGSGGRWLRKKGLLLAERQSVQAEPDALEQATQTALRLGQLAHVDERGQVVSPPTRRPGRRTGTGAHAGYSLHASTVVAAGDREGLERLLRYCARPALSLERLRETQDGRYAYELKYPSLGRTHLVLTPTELLARLSLLVAPPRYPLVRYGGCLLRRTASAKPSCRGRLDRRARRDVVGRARAARRRRPRWGRRRQRRRRNERRARAQRARTRASRGRCWRARGRVDRHGRGHEARRAARRGDAEAVARLGDAVAAHVRPGCAGLPLRRASAVHRAGHRVGRDRPALGEPRAPDDAAGESARAVTDALRDGPMPVYA